MHFSSSESPRVCVCVRKCVCVQVFLAKTTATIRTLLADDNSLWANVESYLLEICNMIIVLFNTQKLENEAGKVL